MGFAPAAYVKRTPLPVTRNTARGAAHHIAVNGQSENFSSDFAETENRASEIGYGSKPVML
jgi:hypothetical protein